MSRFALLVLTLFAATTCAFRFENVSHSLQDPLKKLHPDLQGRPFPTGAFWTNLVLGQGNEVVVSYPYSIKVQKNQLHISYPFRVVTSKSIIQGFTSELILDVGAQPAQIRDFDELSVTVAFLQPSGEILLHLVRGSPYITLEFKATTPVLSSSVNILTMNQNSQFTEATLGNWHKWLLFGSASLQWTQQGQKWNGPANFNGVLRLALALHESDKAILVEHAPVYPVGADISFEPTGPKKIDLTYSWKTKTLNATSTAPLLMTALAHHVQTFLPSQTLKKELQYMCMRGPLTGVIGNVWHLQETIDDVEWDYGNDGVYANPNSPEYKSTISYIQASLEKDIDRFPAFAEDSYNFGKQFGREARLVTIAHRFNKTEVFNKGLAKLQSQIELWLTGNNTDHFVYDKSFGGLITLHGYQSQGEDFGNGYYNDHHFHYGYFIYGLAVIRRFNQSFVDLHHEAIKYILSDIGAPLGQTSSFFTSFPQRNFFPSARHKDWFCGHSYASGLFPQANGKSQESSSEAVNAYYALALFSSLDKDLAYYHYARLLMAMEIRSTKLYWHMQSTQEPTIYEPVFAANKMAGVVSEMDVVYSTWFGDRPAFIHGIQEIPVTPITAFLLPASYVSEERLVLDNLPVMTNPSDIWSSVLRLNSAIVNATEAWTNLLNTEYNYDTWSSASNAMHWIASRPKVSMSPQVKPAPVCFGYPACALAGAFGKSLDCCNTLPGCCPGDNPCCKSDIGSSNSSEHICHDEPACGILGLSCCDSPEGCCTPTPTGQLLGCCKQPKTTSSPSTKKPDVDSAQCFHQPKCAAAGLDCCNSPQGCCQPTATGQLLGCCEVAGAAKTTLPPVSTTCHGEPQCALLGLDCCGSPEGCCKSQPGKSKLLCCSAEISQISVGQSNADNQTCSANSRCLTAGPNGSPLPCCSKSGGCCPGNECCEASWTVEKTFFVILGVLALGGVIYCAVLYLRRKDYRPLERDVRAWYCAGFMAITLGVFFYLLFSVKN